ncbi:hypothetical protein VSH64_40010 [Amycolatopsis rhabdoformis]|uniref:DUF3558 domain-containing protein n=1 Tax=Amycolatopsis rhabdoformis TaxID=1448059 RepID=A0ABZ1I3G7_9PSEU|nr:hypothetical protein [Amycolatopsis rhabdoformis]WSE28948.1 hypothetical protein VSH64_40010 [Amycolatopsis rhabdoformis]
MAIHWIRFVITPAVGLALVATACSPGSATTKRLGTGDVCGLLSTTDLSAVVGSPVNPPQGSGAQCQYSSANQVLTSVSRGEPAARDGVATTVAGIPASRAEVASGDGCVVDVMLTDDPEQLFSVSALLGPAAPAGTKACDLTEKIAGRIVPKLPS